MAENPELAREFASTLAQRVSHSLPACLPAHPLRFESEHASSDNELLPLPSRPLSHIAVVRDRGWQLRGIRSGGSTYLSGGRLGGTLAQGAVGLVEPMQSINYGITGSGEGSRHPLPKLNPKLLPTTFLPWQ